MFGIKKNFGFGCMRLPMIEKEVDTAHFSQMVDTFLQNGFNYFDTARGYIGGKSETALRDCLTSRHPRDSYILTDKLSTNFFETNAQIRPLFEEQLKSCGVDYFDFYLLHAQNRQLYKKYRECNAYETVFELKAEGKIKHVGISFHDKAEVLRQILTDYPQLEVVQIQFNYLDFDDPTIESRKCYEVCREFGKPVIIMEPVKGGILANLPAPAQKVFDDLNGGSNASYAIRFAAGFEGVLTVLSGMGNMDMMNDNIGYMKDFKPLDDKEHEAVKKVCALLHTEDLIPCTACRYCVEVCPKKIPIPDLFSCLNEKNAFKTWMSGYYYKVVTHDGVKASDCIRCGKCEAICPQSLKIRDLLEKTAEAFESKQN